MEYQNNGGRQSSYEDYEKENSVHLQKLNSGWYVFFKYWMLISALLTFKDVISPPSLKDLGIYVEPSLWEKILGIFSLYICKIWEVVNCALVFEGLRRKNLKLMEKVVSSMEIYVLVTIVAGFFSLTTTGLTAATAVFEKQLPQLKLDRSVWTLFSVGLVLFGSLSYYFIYIYGAKKARDALRAHDKAWRSF